MTSSHKCDIPSAYAIDAAKREVAHAAQVFSPF